MHPLPLVVFLTLAAGPDRSTPVGCREDYETCREDCSIDYGGSTTKYRLLTQCIDRCMKDQSECTTRHYSLRDAHIDSLPQKEPDPAMREPERRDRNLPAQDEVRRGVYRASESDPPPPVEPASMKEPEPEPAPEPELAPEPAPAPRPAAKAEKPVPATKAGRSKHAPEPAAAKADDIRIFDDPEPEAEAAAEPEPEPLPAPKPAPKPSEPLRPKPPPEPKKKDIADWDPNEK